MDAADLLAAIVNSSDDAIIGKTIDGVITTWNPAAERMYGYTAKEIIGQPITVLCPPDRVAEIQEILHKIGNGEHVPYHETVRQRKDGTVFPVSVAISPVHDDRHSLIGASSIARDISERYRLQAELRLRTDDLEIAYRDLETFSYSVSHDLRAPLRAMEALSSALLDDCGDSLSDVGVGYAKRIQASTSRAFREPRFTSRYSTWGQRSPTSPRNSSARDRAVMYGSPSSNRPGQRQTRRSSARYCRTCWTTPGSTPPDATTRQSSSG
jgi:PAS domain S-box-containing protein